MGDRRVVVPLGDYHKLQLAIWSGVRSEFYAKDGDEERTEFYNDTTLVCGPPSEPPFRHANGESCHGCQSCLADACEDEDDDDRTESVSEWNPSTRQFEPRPTSTGG